ncbi:MAG: dethiobiotin synthase [Alphaproteobacteria bacterium]|nr:dethiobiotin synthase [Alphaproteobacteria bacterium]
MRPRVMGQGLFVTGAGTEIGKTLIAAALVHQLVSRGQAVRVLKPVISGFDPTQPEMSDTGRLLTAAGIEVTDQAIAPNMAANRAGAPIDLDKVVAHCRAGLEGDGVLVIEGVGGVMAPITDQATVLDWMAALGLPTVLVGGSYLGAISHTLSAAAVLVDRAIPLCGVVVSESADQPVPLAETSAAVVGFLPHTPVIGVPRIPLRPRPWEAVPDLTALVDLPETL